MEHECASPVYSSNNRTFWKNELFVAPWWAQHVYCLGSLRLNAKSSWWKVFAWTPRQQGFLHTFYFSHHSVVRFSVFAKKSRFWFSSLPRACNVNMILYKCSKASIDYPRGTTITKSLCQIYCLKDKSRETFILLVLKNGKSNSYKKTCRC